MKGIFFTVFFFAFYLVNQNLELRTIKVDVSLSSVANISEIIKRSYFVKLETSESCLIKNIKTLSVTKDYIFIADGGERILQFDAKGNFLRQIGKNGRGPEEYLSVIHFTIDSLNSSVIVLSYKKIILYDFKGNYIRSVNLNYLGVYLQPVQQGYWIFVSKADQSNDGKYLNYIQMYTLNKQFSITDSSFVFNVESNIIPGIMSGFVTNMYPISDIGNQIFIYYPYTMTVRDTLYEIRKTKLIPSIKFDFRSVRSVSSNLIISHIYRTSRYVFLNYLILNPKHQGYTFYYDLHEEKSSNIPGGFNDDIYKTGVIGRIIPLNLPGSVFYFEKDGYELDGIINGVNENSNPVVFFITLKD